MWEIHGQFPDDGAYLIQYKPYIITSDDPIRAEWT